MLALSSLPLSRLWYVHAFVEHCLEQNFFCLAARVVPQIEHCIGVSLCVRANPWHKVQGLPYPQSDWGILNQTRVLFTWVFLCAPWPISLGLSLCLGFVMPLT